MLRDEERSIQQQIAGFETGRTARPSASRSSSGRRATTRPRRSSTSRCSSGTRTRRSRRAWSSGRRASSSGSWTPPCRPKEPLAPNRMRLGRAGLGPVARRGRAGGDAARAARHLVPHRRTTSARSAACRVIAGIPPLVTERDLRSAAALRAGDGVAGGGDRHGRRRLVSVRPQQRAAHPAPVGRVSAPCTSTSTASREQPFSATPDPAVPLPDPGAPRGARAAHLRSPGGQGLHRPHGRGGHGQDDAAPHVPRARRESNTASALHLRLHDAVRRAAGVHARGLRHRRARGSRAPSASSR